MDRKKLQQWVPYPAWPCPACQNGYLRIDHKTFNETASRKERLDQATDSHNHHERLNRFTALMRCDHPRCGETATIAGNHHTHWMPDGSEEGYLDESYEALSIIPAPLPFPLDRKIPAAVAGIVREAAALFWSDHKAAVNRVREVIEAVLTNLGVPVLSARGKSLILHQRIDEFRQIDDGKWAQEADILEAAKWIGNAGTHDVITREEALDAFDMLEAVLSDVYVRPRHALLEKVRATNTKNRKPTA